MLRIVYDGPGEAGKTTTMSALGAELGRSLVTPEERDGRTLYFDWLEYTAGGFEGHPLHCQIVSVPGQVEMAQRRAYLLSTADAVIYVAPITAENLLDTLQVLRTLCRSRDGLPIGVVLQANKRDLPNALATSRIRRALSDEGLPVILVESTAIAAVGVRYAFVMAVRLAVDRVREVMQRGELVQGAPEIDHPDGLLAEMRAREALGSSSMADAVAGPGSAVEPATIDAPRHATLSTGFSRRGTGTGDPGRPPALPDVGIASDSIWPPVIGRTQLADALMSVEPPTRHGLGWRAVADGGWVLYSSDATQIRDREEGRSRLTELARLHGRWSPFISGPRCLLLAEDGQGETRLWQVIRERLSLRSRLQVWRCIADTMHSARLWVDTVQRLLELTDVVASQDAKSALMVTLDSAGTFCRRTQYVGAVDWPSVPLPPGPTLRTEIGAELAGWPIAGETLRGAIWNIAGDAPLRVRAATMLCDLIMSHEGSR